jgi:chemotaxis protein methyltransferase WspC
LSVNKQKQIRLSKQKISKPCPDPVRDEQKAVPPTALELVRHLADRGLLEQSSEMCRELLLRNPLDPSLHFLLGEISEAAGRSEESEKHFERALYSDPNHYESLIHLSHLRARKGDPKSSEYYLKRARRAALKAIGQQEHT